MFFLLNFITLQNPHFFRLENPLDSDNPFKVNTFFNSGKVEIILRKKASGRWSQIGQPLQGHDTWVPESQLPTVDVKQFPQYRYINIC